MCFFCSINFCSFECHAGSNKSTFDIIATLFITPYCGKLPQTSAKTTFLLQHPSEKKKNLVCSHQGSHSNCWVLDVWCCRIIWAYYQSHIVYIQWSIEADSSNCQCTIYTLSPSIKTKGQRIKILKRTVLVTAAGDLFKGKEKLKSPSSNHNV